MTKGLGGDALAGDALALGAFALGFDLLALAPLKEDLVAAALEYGRLTVDFHRERETGERDPEDQT